MRESNQGFRLNGLRARLVYIVLLSIVPMAGLLFVYAGIQNDAAQERARSEIQRGLLQEISSVQDLVSESRATLLTFGITYAIQRRDWTLAQGNAERLTAMNPEYAAVAVADPAGKLLVSSTHRTGIDVGDSAVFKQAIETKSLSVSDYHTDPVLGRPAITVGYPVYDEKGALICVEFIAIEIERIQRRMSSIGAGSVVSTLIDGEGVVVARNPVLQSAQGKKIQGQGLVQTVLTRKNGSTTAEGLDGVTREYRFGPVFTKGEGDLYLAAGFSPDALFAEQRRSFIFTLAGFGVFALASLLAAGFIGTRSIYRPMRQLESATKQLAAGDLSARSAMSGRNDEFGVLASEFDSMAGAIQAQVGELEAMHAKLHGLNAELEERVRQRTADLEASNNELEAFNYSVSHDLRAPLRSIDGFSQALLEDQADRLDEEGKDHLIRVKAAANRMGELIDSLLQLSRLSRIPMKPQTVNLTEMAHEVADALRVADPDRQVEVIVRPRLVTKGDPVLLHSVLENLLGNAWKFTNRTEAARIEFGATTIDGEKAFFVRDNGAGFDMAHSNKLFGAFQRLHGQKDFPGIGVGLATVSRVIWRHGGRVWAEGEPGKGAAFFFSLP